MPETELVPETVLTPAPITFIGEQLSPSPWQYRFTGEDALEIASYNSQTGVRVAVQGRMWSADRGLHPFAFTHVPSADRMRRLEVFGLPHGYLLNAVVFASSGTPRMGQTFVSLHVVRGQGQARILLATLLQGYISGEQELAFPGSPIENSLTTEPVPRRIRGTDPAQGLDIFETVPLGARWRVRSIALYFITSAIVATRQTYLKIEGPDLWLGQWSWQALTQPAVQYNAYFWMLGLPTSSGYTPGVGQAGLPDIVLESGSRLQISAANLQATDQFLGPVIHADEWLEAQ
jgi:hypothetical protein